VYETSRLAAAAGGARIFLKREDLTHTGAHKINNASDKRCSPRAWASGGSSPRPARGSTASHPQRRARFSDSSVTSTWAPRTWMPGAQRVRMRLLGAEVCRVDAGSRTLKDAINEAMRDWVTNVSDTYYLLGSVLGRIRTR